MAKVRIEVDEKGLRELVLVHLSGLLGVHINAEDVRIETKSKQNYKSEWESGAGFRATIDKEV